MEKLKLCVRIRLIWCKSEKFHVHWIIHIIYWWHVFSITLNWSSLCCWIKMLNRDLVFIFSFSLHPITFHLEMRDCFQRWNHKFFVYWFVFSFIHYIISFEITFGFLLILSSHEIELTLKIYLNRFVRVMLEKSSPHFLEENWQY